MSTADKTKYRSCAVLECAPVISVLPYVDEFMSDPKVAVKKLTAEIQRAMEKTTINAPDWCVARMHKRPRLTPCRDSLNGAIMTRRLLWRYDSDIPLRSFRSLSQRWVPALLPWFCAEPLAASSTTLPMHREMTCSASEGYCSITETP